MVTMLRLLVLFLMVVSVFSTRDSRFRGQLEFRGRGSIGRRRTQRMMMMKGGKKGKKAGGVACSATEQFTGDVLISLNTPSAAPLRGNVGCVDLEAMERRDITIDPIVRNQSAPNIFGPMEAGFNLTNPGMSCLGSNSIPGGIDTNTAEYMLKYYCDSDDVRVLDACGGHAVPYHYHERMSCLYEQDEETGHSSRIGTAGDGNGIYGPYINGGVEPNDLDYCGGRFGITPDSNGEEVYYYVITSAPPFSIGCYGPVTDQDHCFSLYPETCGEAQTLYEVTTEFGTGDYALDCPCFDSNGNNVLGQEGRPAFMAPGLANHNFATPSPTITPSQSPTSTPTISSKPTITNAPTTLKKKPNFIICQADDLRFFEEWTPPPHFRGDRRQIEIYPETGLPNIDRLRKEGLQMMQAYTASPMCATSRYTTITGRYASRSSVSRLVNMKDPISRISTGSTLLRDIESLPSGNDCGENNLAMVLKKNGYRTGVTGKWHLGDDTPGPHVYSSLQEHIRTCGFDYAESIHAHNIPPESSASRYSHNLEFLTEKAVEFIKDSSDDSPFFLSFNPSVPHSSGNVLTALTEFKCTDTPEGVLSSEPQVKGMTMGTTCEEYRKTVIDRANGATDDNKLGVIWIDDAIGALFTALEESDQLENTFFLFQQDHGQEGKGTLWEPGVRVAQFIHYPDAGFGVNHTSFDGMVQTIDTAPTILDYAGINSSEYYEMDGLSWRPLVENSTPGNAWSENEKRCLFYETNRDRAVRCGCYKYMEIDSMSTTFSRGQTEGLAADTQILFDLCEEKEYKIESNAEAEDIKDDNESKFQQLDKILQCHLDRSRADQTPLNFTVCDTLQIPSDDSGDSLPLFCFSGENTVQVKDERGIIKMRELRVGDEVLVQSFDENNDPYHVGTTKHYEPVYSFGHRNDDMKGSYLRILPSNLELSPDHMIYVQKQNNDNDNNAISPAPIPASMIKVGDILSDGTKVEKIVKAIHRKGVYAPFTTSGNLLVNGVLVSNYIAFQDSSFLTITGDSNSDSTIAGIGETKNINKITSWSWKTPFTFQWLAHAFNAPHRMWWMLTSCPSLSNLKRATNLDIRGTQTNPNKDNLDEEGISLWVLLPLRSVQWLFKQSVMVQILLLTPILMIFGSFVVVESIIIRFTRNPALIATLTVVFTIFSLQQRRKKRLD